MHVALRTAANRKIRATRGRAWMRSRQLLLQLATYSDCGQTVTDVTWRTVAVNVLFTHGFEHRLSRELMYTRSWSFFVTDLQIQLRQKIWSNV